MTDVPWVSIPAGSGFGIENLPYGVFSLPGELPRVGVAIGNHVLDLAGLAAEGLVDDRRWFASGSLNGFMAAGRAAWEANRARIIELLTIETYRERVEPHLIPLDQVELARPFDVADYVDFYSSIHHAANVGRIFRPHADPLPPNWRHLPVGYHGRAGTVQVSGTPVYRPWGQRRETPEQEPSYGPSRRLDFEAEIGFVAGMPSAPGHPLPTSAFRDHIFGFVLVNDWSARDIQAWESQPLGPFLSKSFATSISPWVVPVAALEAARVAPPTQDPPVLPYLRCDEPWGLDVTVEILLNGQVISRPPFASMYWTSPQQLAHATVGGAPLRTGDLFASGTVSGPERDQRGCLLELTWGGTEPIELADGTRRTFLEDGDTVTIRAFAPTAGGGRLSLGEVTGTVHPSPAFPSEVPGAILGSAGTPET
ncbi:MULTISPECIES: fumarylacetoacetase [Thermomonospora]|uniref:fumarylacetoacetase n=1 Tax=Thermomonospora curvata (strain ATCC 19995 / DSM 43183 / JCM 3096 / KCTC 9072 / NBRC 15933 / NCIMB 10081 / Henssen B9) TaxID=471852 RepID=D1A5D9_THECD|nr:MULTISPECIES: fumarylacetoacetase [Thermomonospora]ACY96299.1 fumarylacetoacetase [Thermomonospora curvata DSM 43183]PKK15716.1 MAG: fumarylacetoacetase [Thermomonospora sp. CIF 1]